MNTKEYIESVYKHALVRKARDFAEKKHQGQTRRDGTPYFAHPTRVADNIKKYKQSEELPSLIAAAFMHDTIEDGNATVLEIKELFGDLVADLVHELTSDEEEKIKMGKTPYLVKKMLKMSDWALVIKLADRLDNVSDLETQTDEFKKKYKLETETIIDSLLRDRRLTNTQKKIINQIQKKLYKVK
ncbi:MAG TPA: HD domain-containing protein [Clostridia bacterium]|nr:HD domain-containing protein [Clostridia bacterium]